MNWTKEQFDQFEKKQTVKRLEKSAVAVKPKRAKSRNEEYVLAKQIAAYLRTVYPDVLFHFDGSGNNLSMAQRIMMKTIQGKRGFPDLFIIERRVHKGLQWAGLFLELKKEGTKLMNGKNNYATPHLHEQSVILKELTKREFMANFAIGYSDAVKQIDWYLQTQ